MRNWVHKTFSWTCLVWSPVPPVFPEHRWSHSYSLPCTPFRVCSRSPTAGARDFTHWATRETLSLVGRLNLCKLEHQIGTEPKSVCLCSVCVRCFCSTWKPWAGGHLGKERGVDVRATCRTEVEGTYSWSLRGSLGGAPGWTVHSWAWGTSLHRWLVPRSWLHSG